MRRGSFILLMIALLGVVALSCEKEELSEDSFADVAKEREVVYWTCGMHPSVRVSPDEYEETRSKCPICRMDLVPVYKEAIRGEEVMPTVTLSSYGERLAGVKTEMVAYRRLTKEILTVGKLDYDARRIAHVAARVGGRIEELFVDFEGMPVKKGRPLASIYSPQLVSAQEEYLLALQTLDKVKSSDIPEIVDNARTLVESSKMRLLLWGTPEREIERLGREQEPRIDMIIYSPIDGTVVEKSVLPGQYVKEGDHLYTVAELSLLWILADIYEYEMSWIRLGQEVEVTTPAYPGETFVGEVSFIDPVLHPATRSVKIRADIPNLDGRLKPEMFVNATIEIPVTTETFPELIVTSGSAETATYICDCTGKIWTQSADEDKSCPYCGPAMPECGRLVKPDVEREKTESRPEELLALPASSLLDTGNRKVVYVDKGAGDYEMREVRVGPRAGGYYPLIDGVQEGERVVVRANFLIDSQTQLGGPAATMYDASIEHERGHQR